jgi:hypothetical protein
VPPFDVVPRTGVLSDAAVAWDVVSLPAANAPAVDSPVVIKTATLATTATRRKRDRFIEFLEELRADVMDVSYWSVRAESPVLTGGPRADAVRGAARNLSRVATGNVLRIDNILRTAAEREAQKGPTHTQRLHQQIPAENPR